MKIILPLATALVSYTSLSVAQTERDLDSHEHGSASLNVAIVDSTVLLELNTPWNNLVGFEHEPRTDEQHEKVDKAMELLNDPSQLLSFNNGDCVPEDVMIETSMSDDEHGGEHDHDDEHDHDKEHDEEHGDEHDHDKEHDEEHGDEHDHDKEHDEEHGDEHDHDKEHDEEHGDEHDHDDHDEDTHSAALVSYSYQCGDIASLTSIDMTLFSIWSGFEHLDVQLVGEKGQTLVELDQNNTVLDLSSVK